MTKQTNAPLIAGLLLLSCQQAQAHLHTHDIGALSNVGDSVSGTTNRTNGFGWIAGTDNDLGNSHYFNNGAISFSLTQAATVQISVSVAANVAINPAFSVYAGVLPQASHDAQAPDDYGYPYKSYDSSNQYGLIGIASTMDKRPDDPLIRRYIPAGYDVGGNPLTYSGYEIIYTENPIWNTPAPNLGGLSPAQWYEANYQPHNGYIDTLNFTTQGGLAYFSDEGVVLPANWNPDGILAQTGLSGQFDAFGDWSMANEAGEWAKIHYISSVSSTACNGPNCLTTDTGGFSNAGHFAGNDGLTETLTLMLGPGAYSIFAAGEACMDYETDCMPGGQFYGSQLSDIISYNVTLLAPAAVPLPGAFWLMGSALLGLGGLHANRARG